MFHKIRTRYSPSSAPYSLLERAGQPLVGMVGLFAFLGSQVLLPMAAAQAQGREPAVTITPAPEWAKNRKQGRASKPGRIKPSPESNCKDCEVTMQALDLKRVPTEKELRMAGQLGGALNPIGNADVVKLTAALDEEMERAGVNPAEAAKAGPTHPAGKLHQIKIEKIETLKKINHSFGAAIQEWNKHNFRRAAKMFEEHVEAFPESPWNGEALLHLGCDAKYNGQFSEAQSKYDYLLEHTSGAKGSDSFEIHQKAKLRWADLDIALGRFDDAQSKLANIIKSDNDWRRRTWAQHWMTRTAGGDKNRIAAAACGSLALSQVFTKLDKSSASVKLAALKAPREAGYSMAELQSLAAQNGVPMRGFQATSAAQLADLPTPMIVHYDFVGVREMSRQNAELLKKEAPSLTRGFASSLKNRTGQNPPLVLAPPLEEQDPKTPPAHETTSMATGAEVQEACCGAAGSVAPQPRKQNAADANDRTLTANAFRSRDAVPGHFLVLQKVDKARQIVEIYDPLQKRLYHLGYSALERDWSGKGLVIASKLARNSGQEAVTPSRRVASASDDSGSKAALTAATPRLSWLDTPEMQRTFGGCCGIPSPEDIDCRENVGGSSDCNGGDADCATLAPDGGGSGPYGSPVWSVNRLNLNLHVGDIPLWYQTPIGPDVEVTLSYNSQDATTLASPFGNKWVFNYRSYVVEDTAANGGRVTVFNASGSKSNYTPNGSGGYTPDKVDNNNTLQKTSSTRYEITFEGGGKAIYDIPSGSASLQPFLVQLKDRFGYSLNFAYVDSGIHTNLTKITDAQGKETILEYDQNGHIVRVTDPFERQATFSYDSNGNMIEVVDVEGQAFQYTYDADINITQLDTAQGAWQFYHERPDGDQACVDCYPAPGGATWESARLTITDPLGQKEEFFYNGGWTNEGSPIIDPQIEEFLAYGLTWHVDKNHYVEYTQQHNNSKPSVPKTRWISDSYVGGKPVVRRMLTPVGDNTEIAYDSATAQPYLIIDPRGKQTWVSYNSAGRPTSITDPKSQTTTIAYASNGIDVASITNAQNTQLFTATYNAYRQPTSVTDAYNNTTTATYTTWGAPASVTNPNGEITLYHYDSTSKQLVSVGQKASANATEVTIDAFTYDNVGRVRTTTNVNGLTLTYDYNNLDKVTKMTYPDSTTTETEYVCCGMPGVVKDRAGRKSYYDYDPMKRLTRMQDAAGNSVQTEYDKSGNATKLIDARGSATHWQYDADHRVSRKTYGDGNYDAYTYSGGLLSQSRNPRGQVTSYSYDNNGNVTGINHPTSADVALTYDSLDRVTQMIDGIGTTAYGYDTLSRLTSENGPWANDTVAYAYDSQSRRSAMQINGTNQTSYAYDALNRLEQLTSPAGTWAYGYVGNSGLLSQINNPNGTKSEYTYDALERLSAVANTTSANANLSSFAYGFDAANTPQRDVRTYVDKTIGANATQRVSYTYDTVDQLISEVSDETTPLLNKSYAYDAMGNRTGTQSVSAADTIATGYSSNRLNQYLGVASNWGGGANTSASTLSYDASGNLTKMASAATGTGSASNVEYLYDDTDRLISMVKKNPTTLANEKKTEFMYDGLSRLRISKEYTWTTGAWVQDSEKRRVYDGMDVVEERDAANVTQVRYTRYGNIGGILAKSSADGNFCFHYDGSGNVIGLSDSTQASVADYSYDVYGNLLSTSGTQANANQYRYSTKEYFGSVGLYNFGYRFYSMGLGRWVNRDPIQEEGGLNLYAIVHNNPVNDWDEYGENGAGATAVIIVIILVKIGSKLIPRYKTIRKLIQQGGSKKQTPRTARDPQRLQGERAQMNRDNALAFQDRKRKESAKMRREMKKDKDGGDVDNMKTGMDGSGKSQQAGNRADLEDLECDMRYTP